VSDGPVTRIGTGSIRSNSPCWKTSSIAPKDADRDSRSPAASSPTAGRATAPPCSSCPGCTPAGRGLPPPVPARARRRVAPPLAPGRPGRHRRGDRRRTLPPRRAPRRPPHRLTRARPAAPEPVRAPAAGQPVPAAPARGRPDRGSPPPGHPRARAGLHRPHRRDHHPAALGPALRGSQVRRPRLAPTLREPVLTAGWSLAMSCLSHYLIISSSASVAPLG